MFKVDQARIKSVTDRAIDLNGIEYELDVAQEELIELAQSLSKWRRKEPYWQKSLLEEYADVLIVLEYVKTLITSQIPYGELQAEANIKTKIDLLDKKLQIAESKPKPKPKISLADLKKRIGCKRNCERVPCKVCALDSEKNCHMITDEALAEVQNLLEAIPETEYMKYVCSQQ